MKALINSCRQSCKLHGSAVCCCTSSSTSLYFVCFFSFFYPHLVVFICTYTIGSLYDVHDSISSLCSFSPSLSLSFTRSIGNGTICGLPFQFHSSFCCKLSSVVALPVSSFFCCCARFIKLTMKCVLAAKRIMRLKNETHKTRRLHKIDTVNNKTIHIFQDKHQQMSASASA